MPFQGWNQLLNADAPWQTTTGTNLTTATTATISPQAGGAKDYVVATSYLYPGAVFRCIAQGFLTTTGTSTTATIFIAAGATPTTLVTPSGITTGTTALTGLQWYWESYHRVTAIASTGNTISSQGYLHLAVVLAATPTVLGAPQNLTTVGAGGLRLPAPNASGETAAAIDTTSNMAIMMRGTLAGANATVNCSQFFVEQLD
jgi:hypothetical protein